MIIIYPLIIALMYTINTLKKINVSYKKKKIVLYPYNGIQFSKKSYKPLPTIQMTLTDIMLNNRHKRVCIVWFDCITLKDRCPEWFLQVEDQRLTARRTRNFRDACPRHMLCLDPSGGDKVVHIFKHGAAHFRLVRFMLFTVCISQ